MIESLKDVLARNAPSLLARTKLPRNSPNYLTQRQAFDIYRASRLEELEREAPDLFGRLALPLDDPNHLDTTRAYAMFHGRKREPNK